jgi:lipid II:glycine glycyltransferase (peptidoglycan interpeptide bridge formation enzyme)
MIIRSITPSERKAFNFVVNHPLQAYEWGEFREKTGVKVIRRGMFDPSTGSGQGKLVSGFQLTIHKIPHTSYTIGYLPKGEMPTKELLEELKKIGKEEKCIFIQLEPNIEIEKGKMRNEKLSLTSHLSSLISLQPAAHPLFTRFTFVLDLTKSEEEILAGMHQKARYNIKVAQKNGVEVSEDNSDKSFKEYLRLTRETTERQKFYAHTEDYHKLMWQTLGGKNSNIEARNSKQIQNTKDKNSKRFENYDLEHSKIVSDFVFLPAGRQGRASDLNQLRAHLFVARYKGKILTSWVLFTFKNTLYYPYGASSSENREVMSSNLMMWEAIRYGKKLGLKKFDMWGALGPTPDKKDPWYGFHSFKEKYGPEHVEFIGSYDLVINPVLYQAYRIADKLRWLYLRIKK